MSGGAFDYNQFHIKNIADSIEQEILKNGREKTKEELENNWYPDDLKHYEYPEEVILQFKTAVALLRITEIYVHRIDYLLSGDDGEETFLNRLKEDLKNKLHEEL